LTLERAGASELLPGLLDVGNFVGAVEEHAHGPRARRGEVRPLRVGDDRRIPYESPVILGLKRRSEPEAAGDLDGVGLVHRRALVDELRVRYGIFIAVDVHGHDERAFAGHDMSSFCTMVWPPSLVSAQLGRASKGLGERQISASLKRTSVC